MSLKEQSSGEFKPLYQKIEQVITNKIIAGEWKPGEMLPSEFQLADSLNVSQGTVRKALNSLGESNIVFRRQGVGTFVSENTLKDMLFHFFHYKANDGEEKGLPSAELIDIQLIDASAELACQLEIAQGDSVIKIIRIRKLAKKPCIAEQIYLPQCFFTQLDIAGDLPNSLYHYYQESFNITINKAADKIRAVIADDTDYELIGVTPGMPLLEVSRQAKALDGRLVEYRISRVDSEQLHYLVDLN
jgi:GntR family transcriptional regulator